MKYIYSQFLTFHGSTMFGVGPEWEFVCISTDTDGREVFIFRKQEVKE